MSKPKKVQRRSGAGSDSTTRRIRVDGIPRATPDLRTLGRAVITQAMQTNPDTKNRPTLPSAGSDRHGCETGTSRYEDAA